MRIRIVFPQNLKFSLSSWQNRARMRSAWWKQRSLVLTHTRTYTLDFSCDLKSVACTREEHHAGRKQLYKKYDLIAQGAKALFLIFEEIIFARVTTR